MNNNLGTILATGSRDCTCLLWDIKNLIKDHMWVTDKETTTPKPKQILYGHQMDITCIDINITLDIIATGSLVIIMSITRITFRRIAHA